MIAWVKLAAGVVSLVKFFAQLLRDKALREEGRRGAFSDIYKAELENAKRSNTIRSRRRSRRNIFDRL